MTDLNYDSRLKLHRAEAAQSGGGGPKAEAAAQSSTVPRGTEQRPAYGPRVLLPTTYQSQKRRPHTCPHIWWTGVGAQTGGYQC